PAPAPADSAPHHPAYAHAADYSWLVGVLEYRAERNQWAVRYTSGGDGDRYDGMLVLVNPGPMVGFRPGELVRVAGELVDPAPHEIKPSYRARALQVLERR